MDERKGCLSDVGKGFGPECPVCKHWRAELAEARAHADRLEQALMDAYVAAGEPAWKAFERVRNLADSKQPEQEGEG